MQLAHRGLNCHMVAQIRKGCEVLELVEALLAAMAYVPDPLGDMKSGVALRPRIDKDRNCTSLDEVDCAGNRGWMLISDCGRLEQQEVWTISALIAGYTYHVSGIY